MEAIVQAQTHGTIFFNALLPLEHGLAVTTLCEVINGLCSGRVQRIQIRRVLEATINSMECGERTPEELPPRRLSSAHEGVGITGSTSEDATTTTINNHNTRHRLKRRCGCSGSSAPVASITSHVSKRRRNRDVCVQESPREDETRSPSPTRTSALRQAEREAYRGPQHGPRHNPFVKISGQDLEGNLDDAVAQLTLADNGLEACADLFRRIHSPDTFYRLSKYVAGLHDVPSTLPPSHGSGSLHARQASQLPRPVVLDRYLLSLCSLIESDIQARDERKILYMWRCCEAFQHWNEVKDAFENEQHKDHTRMRQSVECYRQQMGNGSLVRNLSLLKAYIAFCMDCDWQEDEGDDARQHNGENTWAKNWNIYMTVGGAVSAMVETFGMGILALTPYTSVRDIGRQRLLQACPIFHSQRPSLHLLCQQLERTIVHPLTSIRGVDKDGLRSFAALNTLKSWMTFSGAVLDLFPQASAAV